MVEEGGVELLIVQRQLPMLRILTGRGAEYCGRAERHEYVLHLAVDDIDHAKTKAPQTSAWSNGTVARWSS